MSPPTSPSESHMKEDTENDFWHNKAQSIRHIKAPSSSTLPKAGPPGRSCMGEYITGLTLPALKAQTTVGGEKVGAEEGRGGREGRREEEGGGEGDEKGRI